MKFPRHYLNSLVLFIAALLFISGAEYLALHDPCDLIPLYTGARCLLHGCNPYDPSQLEQQYFQSGGSADEPPSWSKTPPVYPPSTLLVITPLTLLRYPAARLLWFLLNGCLFAIAAGLILSSCPRQHRWLAAILLSVILISSKLQLETGNPTTFAVSLLAIGCYLFLRGRFLPLGAFLLMLSLAAKPQMGGLIVLYLLIRGIHRRYTLAAMAGALVLLLSASLILSLNPRSAGWTSDLHAHISTSVEGGAVNDPRPTSKYASTMVNLQGITSVFFADEQEYNAAAYAIFLALLAVMIVTVLRTNASPDVHWLSIGALAALTLMPVYHRFYDTRLLLIAVPAVLIVYRKHRLLGAIIGVLTILAIVSGQSRVQMFFQHHPTFNAEWEIILQNKLLFVLLLRQQNLALPILFCLYIVAIFSIRFPSAPALEFAAQHPKEVA
ncbi:MAG: glycosyltransferase family 87 protein [Terracidiphilus sp.]